MDGAGAPIREYAFYPGVDEPHSLRRGSDGAVFYYAQEVPGDVVGLISGGNALVNEYEYRPFGSLEWQSEATPNPLRFQARELDAASALYYVRNRWYDPELARFLSEDPIGLEGGSTPTPRPVACDRQIRKVHPLAPPPPGAAPTPPAGAAPWSAGSPPPGGARSAPAPGCGRGRSLRSRSPAPGSAR